MLFNSFEFILIFLPFALGSFYLLRSVHFHAAIWCLIGTSFVFYGWWNPPYVLLLLFSVVWNYGIARCLKRYGNSRKRWTAQLLFFAGISVNIVVLGYFKYMGFFITTINNTLNLGWTFTGIILPLAISFFTFQQIAFLVEVKQGIIKEFSFMYYTLFVVFFPQLIAGPIVHFREVCDQYRRLVSRRRFAVDLAVGLSIFTIGLFKKVVLADTMAMYADPVFGATGSGLSITFVEAWTGLLAFTAQIYFDFSGYSDMAIGLARLFGIRLPINFFSPYKAGSIIEFWKRWHMTLSRFLRDYLYIPLGGNRQGNLRRDVNIIITMLIAGLWHGAAWTFIVWGGLHGVYMIINHRWRQLCKALGFSFEHRFSVINPALHFLAIGFTFFAVAFAWIFFRSESFSAASLIMTGISGAGGARLPVSYETVLGPLAPILGSIGWTFGDTPFWGGAEAVLWLVLAYSCLWLLPSTQQIFRYYRPAVYNQTMLVRHESEVTRIGRAGSRFESPLVWRANYQNGCLFAGMAVIALIFLFVGHDHEFIYFQF